MKLAALPTGTRTASRPSAPLTPPPLPGRGRPELVAAPPRGPPGPGRLAVLLVVVLRREPPAHRPRVPGGGGSAGAGRSRRSARARRRPRRLRGGAGVPDRASAARVRALRGAGRSGGRGLQELLPSAPVVARRLGALRGPPAAGRGGAA